MKCRETSDRGLVIAATGTAADLIPKVKTIMIKEGIINGTD